METPSTPDYTLDMPNKRWTGKVERVLRKKLFAKDWGIDLEDEQDDRNNPWIIK